MVNTSFNQYAKVYNLIYKDKPYWREVDYLESLFSKYSAKKVESVLDLAAGTGAHVLELAKRGYKCYGSDISEEMVQVARETISQKKLDIPFICAPMQELQVINRKFDAVICMFSAINYLNHRVDVLKFLNTVREYLNPNGLLIFDFWNGIEAMNNFEPLKIKEFSDEKRSVLRMSRSSIDKMQNLILVEFEIIVFESQRIQSRYKELHKVRYFFPVEIKELLEEAGYTLMHIGPFMDLTRPFHVNDWNVSIVARV